jgi:argininosuccinate lyase
MEPTPEHSKGNTGHLWKSALNAGLPPALHSMNASIHFDVRLWPHDIEGSRAHIDMLERAQLLSSQVASKLQCGLNALEADILAGRTTPLDSDEDVHAFVERELVERVGPEGSNIHIARSRNEQVVLDTLLYLRQQTKNTVAKFDVCLASLQRLSNEAGVAYMPSYTHLRRAQPMSVARMWDAHATLWRHAQKRFARISEDVAEECPMGAGAINGTTLPTDPEWEAQRLGFQRSAENPLAALSNRHALLEFSAAAVHWLLDVSRLMEDLINWSTSEFGFVSLSAHVTTGSSMMPQKRNPDICELLRANAALAQGHYTALMGLLKGLPMGYMKDLQNDKVALFAIADILDSTLSALPLLLEGVTFQTDAAKEAASDPLLLATDVMEWCVSKGTPLRQAHSLVAALVHEHLSSGKPFSACIREKWPDFPIQSLNPAQSCQMREHRNAKPPSHWLLAKSKTGAYMASKMKPTMPPITTNMAGSIIFSAAAMAESTSSS